MPTPIIMPEAGESVVSGVLTAWTKADGDYVERDETVAEIETDKITVEVLAPAAGVLKHTAAEGDEVEVKAAIGEVDESASKPAGDSPKAEAAKAEGGADTKPEPKAATATEPKPEPKPAPVATTNGAAAGHVNATPVAKRLAEENKVDLGALHGTGPGGRIREQDVLAVVHAGSSRPTAPAPQPAAGAGSRGTSLERMSPLRQKVASRLVEAQHTAAMLTTFNEVDMTSVMALRKRYKEPFGDKHGIGLGFMSFFVKAAVGALRAFPKVNSYIVTDQDGKPAIQSHDYQDVAIAVSSPKGLVVPVVRNCESLSFAGIEKAIKDFGLRAKDGKLSLEEMQGGTFTITNGGIFGSLLSTPILNPPQSAILGMHGIKNRPVEHPDKPGEVALRPMMYLALSYDHRIVDGAEAVRFLVHIKDAIEDPTRLLLDV